MSDENGRQSPIYSHNPYHSTRFPLLVLDVRKKHCAPYNEGFGNLHWHEEVQFVYVKKGIVHFKIWEKEYDLQQGGCMFLNANVMHWITEKSDCHYHSFLIPPKMLGFFGGSVMQTENVERITENPAVTNRIFLPGNPGNDKVLERLRCLDEMYFSEKQDNFREYELSLCIAGLWLETARILISEEEIPAIREKDHDRIQKLLTFVHENYQSRLTLEDIASAGSVSKSECLRCFRKYTGFSPYQYLLRYRLQAGASLLGTTDASVTEIALHLQFPSSSAFIAAFRRSFGVTPTAYRRENPRHS